jgi:hypothetical protein
MQREIMIAQIIGNGVRDCLESLIPSTMTTEHSNKPAIICITTFEGDQPS